MYGATRGEFCHAPLPCLSILPNVPASRSDVALRQFGVHELCSFLGRLLVLEGDERGAGDWRRGRRLELQYPGATLIAMPTDQVGYLLKVLQVLLDGLVRGN
jgi:hypothetical protein